MTHHKGLPLQHKPFQPFYPFLPPMHKHLPNFLIYLKGVLMGTCDVIPGVSGGTIAFITGIYERLLDSIASINLTTLRLVLQWQFAQARRKIDGTFLVLLLGGIATAIITFAKLVKRLLAEHPVLVRAFFGGLLIASAWIIFRNIKKRNLVIIIMAIIGTTLGYLLTSMPLFQTEPSLTSTFGAGAIAIMAMILPGISGSYILIILNHYHHVLDVLVNVIETGQDREYLLIFIFGAIIGLLAFAKFLHWVKKHYYQQLLALLSGFILGSLHLLRPRKETISRYTNSKGEELPLIQEKILPTDPQQILLVISLVTLGAAIVIGINRLGKK